MVYLPYKRNNRHSVTSIGENAFYNCTSLTSITIPDSVTEIGSGAFYDTSYYNNEANWENGVLYIGNHLIKAKEDISGSYEIKQGTKIIAAGAFDGCTSLKSITIPDSVTSLGKGVFSWCTALTAINVSENNTAYSSIDGVVFSKDKTELVCYPAGKTAETYAIPAGVTSIGHAAFSYCTSLTSVTIPSSVKIIGSYAFYSTSLTSVTIPDGVEYIYEYAFGGCEKLSYVYLPDSIKNVEYSHPEVYPGGAFSRTPFYESSDIRDSYGVYYSGNIAFGGSYDCDVLKFREGTVTIADGYYGSCKVYIPSSVKNIGDNIIFVGREMYANENAERVFYGYAGSYAEAWVNSQEDSKFVDLTPKIKTENVSVDGKPQEVIYMQVNTDFVTVAEALRAFKNSYPELSSAVMLDENGAEITDTAMLCTEKMTVSAVTADGSTLSCSIKADGQSILMGDVNGDGKVSAVDARWALQCAAKKRTLDEKQTKAADMNKDGKITAVDARQILKKAAGKA